RWVTDRRTNLPVHCCDESPAFAGEAYLKFPFGVEKRTYQWWDNTLGGTVPMRFTDTTRVAGREGYRFTGSVAPTRT
ncbi:porin PorA family protein, partial [Streptomyces sp. URMC 126]